MNLWKSHRKILFAVTGGIAAYKAPDILHGWIKAGCEVETILTESAEEFVSPLVLSTLSKRRVWRERDFLSSEDGWKIPHIALTDWADVMVVAPCTANVLRMCAEGDSSTLLGAALLANTKPLLLFPAMNSKMLANPATVRYIKLAREMGHTVIDPDAGMLACGYEGKGRLPSNDVIYEHVWKVLSPKTDFAGLKVLVTAGPTHEYLDPVRYISNPSTGKMGYAIAKAAWYRGAEVTLVSGPCSINPPQGVNLVRVKSAEQMYEACMKETDNADVIIKSAAVGDFRAETESEQKIKRKSGEPFELKLVQNHDIAAELGKVKRQGQILVGFAAETQDILQNAKKKMEAKNLDIIAVNDVLAKGAGFASETNTITLIPRSGESLEFSGSKDDAADVLLDEIVQRRQNF